MTALAATGDPVEDVARRLPPPDEAAARAAGWAALCLAADPVGLGGAVVRGGAGSPGVRAWMELLGEASGRRRHRVPPGVDREGLEGGTDLVASASEGRIVRTAGLLARAEGGILVVPMAEDLPRAPAASLAGAVDRGRAPLVLLDEGREGPGAPPALRDRVAFHLGVSSRWRAGSCLPGTSRSAAEAREALGSTAVPGEVERALVGAAADLGLPSMRPALFAVRAARALASLRGRAQATEEDARLAAELVLAPRAAGTPDGEPPPGEGEGEEEPPEEEAGEEERRSPEEEPEEPAARDRDEGGAAEPEEVPRPEPEPEESDGEPPERDPDRSREGSARERLVDAVRVAVPELRLASGRTTGSGRSGRGGGDDREDRRGRRIGTRRGRPPRDGPLDLAATLRAAAPWQTARRDPRDPPDAPRLRLRPRDLRVQVRAREPGTTTIFAVDASGSQALRRLGETKGAVELLLSRSYARRDRVSLVAFRGRRAEVVLPPTRALARARRELTGIAGGGGTPLPSGLEEARRVAERVLRDGDRAALVVLTDGGANVTRDGDGDRGLAREQSLGEARALAELGAASAVLDTSARGRSFVRELADALGASYRHLPRPTAQNVGEAVRQAVGPASREGG